MVIWDLGAKKPGALVWRVRAVFRWLWLVGVDLWAGAGEDVACVEESSDFGSASFVDGDGYELAGGIVDVPVASVGAFFDSERASVGGAFDG